jgi:hypothetical protein
MSYSLFLNNWPQSRISSWRCRHKVLTLPGVLLRGAVHVGRRWPACPSVHHSNVDSNQVERSTYGVVDDVIECLRVVVERGHWGTQMDAHLRGLMEEAGVANMERALSRHQDQRPALLEHHIGRSSQEIV